MSVSYKRTALKEWTATLTEEALLRYRIARAWYLSSLASGPPARTAPELDRTILCWWCRSYHRASEVDRCMVLPRKQIAATSNGTSSSGCLPGGMLSPFKELWAFLTEISYPDGQKRQTGKLSLSFSSNGCLLTLTDDTTGQYAAMTGQSVDDVFLAMELALEADKVPWRASKFSSRGRR